MGAELQRCGRICGSEQVKKKPSKPQKSEGLQDVAPLTEEEPRPELAAADEWKKLQLEVGKLDLPKWVNSRPAGTPVQDEGFICMGGMAPRCPPPPPKVHSGPITLTVLQGSWCGSSGMQVGVTGTDVFLNGLPLKDHKVQLTDDGTVLSIGKLWQLQGWAADGGLEWRASSTRENMECARSEVWSRKESVTNAASLEKMKLLGYAGSSANPLSRGVEGCMPGTMGIEQGEIAEKDLLDVKLLAALVEQWREPELSSVLSFQVVPDFTNRAQTGLGVELVHYVASSILAHGFKKRKGNDGHDIPVVVREPVNSEFYEEAMSLWKSRVEEEPGFPPVRVQTDKELFTSLGNGHFFQALNLFACQCPGINDSKQYLIGSDKDLDEAITKGVPSLVLKHETPRPVRAKIAELLNIKRDFHWALNADGTVDATKMDERTSYCSQFEWLSKGMDAAQVDCLVRTHLGIKDSNRIQG